MSASEIFYLLSVGLAGFAVVIGMFGIVAAATTWCEIGRRRRRISATRARMTLHPGNRRPDWTHAPEWAAGAIRPFRDWMWYEFDPQENNGNPGRIQRVTRFLDQRAPSQIERRPHGE